MRGAPRNKPKRKEGGESFEPFCVPQHRGVPLLALFRGVTPESEITLVNQLSILFQKCGLRFWCHPAEDHGTPQNACYFTSFFSGFFSRVFFLRRGAVDGQSRGQKLGVQTLGETEPASWKVATAPCFSDEVSPSRGVFEAILRGGCLCGGGGPKRDNAPSRRRHKTIR